MVISSHICPTSPYPHSNSCMWAQTPASHRSPSTAAACTGRPVLSAALPETRTAPGMERPAPATSQTPKGVWHKHKCTPHDESQTRKIIWNSCIALQAFPSSGCEERWPQHPLLWRYVRCFAPELWPPSLSLEKISPPPLTHADPLHRTSHSFCAKNS